MAGAWSAGPQALAADVVHTWNSGITGQNWTSANWSPAGTPNAIGDIAQYNFTTTVASTILDQAIVLASIRQTAGTSWTITSPGSFAFTLDGTGMSAANNGFNNAGTASINNTSGGSKLSVRTDLVLSNTDLDIGFGSTSVATGTGEVNIGSTTVNATAITNGDATAHNINFRNNASLSTTTVNSKIGATGGTINLSNLGAGGTGAVTLAGDLGPSVGTIIQNSTSSRLVLSGTNTNSGPITITAGVLEFTKAAAFYNGDTSRWTTTNVTVNSGATLAFAVGGAGQFTTADIANFLTATGTAQLFGTGARLGLDVASALTYSGIIGDTNGGANAIGFQKLGSGTLALTGANTYSGITVITAGTLKVDATQGATSGPLGSGAGAIFFNGGTLQFSANNTADYSSRFSTSAGNAVNIDTNGQSVSFASNLTSSGGSVSKSGAGTLNLSGSNTYSGTTTVSAGTLILSGNSTIAGNISASASGAILQGSDSTIYTNASNAMKKVFGTATLVLANGSTLQLRANGTDDASAQTMSITNGVLASAAGSNYTINVDRQASTGGTGKTIAMGNLNNGANTTINFTGANGFNLSVGVVQAGGGTTPSTLTLNPTTASVAVASVGSGTNSVSPTIKLDGTAAGNVVTGAIANNSSTTSGIGTAVLKTNTSTWTLNGANSYTGATTVNGGTLFVKGSIAGSTATTTVGAAGTLGGAGTVNPAISILGTLSPGNTAASTGKFTAASTDSTAALDFSGGGTYLWELGSLKDNTSGIAGLDFDQISLTGSGANLKLAGTSKLTLGFDNLIADPNSNATFWTTNHTWTIIAAAAGVTNTGSTNFASITNASFFSGTFSTVADANGNVTLNYLAVPEPNALTSLLGGFITLLGFQRFRRSRTI